MMEEASDGSTRPLIAHAHLQMLHPGVGRLTCVREWQARVCQSGK